MAQPEIAVLVSSYQRPGHLRRVLASIAGQKGVRGTFEVVATDDGSQDETASMVRRFAASVSFPVRFTTHPHDGFQLARCRNEGVAASTAPYLLFLDGDCLIPPDHLQMHLERRRAGYAMAGYYVHLDQATSERITEEDARLGNFVHFATWQQRARMRWRHVQASFYSLLRDPTTSVSTATTRTFAAGAARMMTCGCGCGRPALASPPSPGGRMPFTCGIPRRPRRRKPGGKART